MSTTFGDSPVVAAEDGAGALEDKGGTLLDDSTGRSWLPDWSIDLVAVVAMGLIALWAFVPSFGWDALKVGAVALILGALWALLASWKQWPWWLLVLGALALFIACGPMLVAPTHTLGGFVPTAGAILLIVKGLFVGWSDALVSLTPIGQLEALLVLPFGCGLVIGVASTSWARSNGRWWLATPLIPIATLIGALSISTDRPVGGIQGAALALVVVTWLASRQRRTRSSAVIAVRDRVRRRRFAGLVVVALAFGLLFGSLGLVSNAGSRWVPRDSAVPPLDLDLAASPLSQYRVFKVHLKNVPLFSVSGPVQGRSISFAAANYWDGQVWQSAPASSNPSESFERVGSAVPISGVSPPTGSVALALAGGWKGQPWLPRVGEVERISFSGPGGSTMSDGLRYNVATDTFAVPSGVVSGSVIDELSSPGDVSGLPSRTDFSIPPGVSAALSKLESKAQCGAQGVQQLNCTANFLHRHGVLSDGLPNQATSLAGESAARLASLAAAFSQQTSSSTTAAVAPTGDGEQFVALLGTLAAQEGFRVRVVVGVLHAQPGVVRGSDVSAWAEIYSGNHWVTLDDPTPSNTKGNVQPPRQQQVDPVAISGPTPAIPPLQTHQAQTNCAKGSKSSACASHGSSGLGVSIPAWILPAAGIPTVLLFLFAGVTLALIGLKTARRNRRRRSGTPAERIGAGWKEVVDIVRDAGWILPTNATRRESAVLIGKSSVSRLARNTDGILFGPDDVASELADSYWSDVDATSSALLASLGPFERWKARVNLTSLGIGDAFDRAVASIRNAVRPLVTKVRRLLDRIVG